jgi:MYXO-CTERM domain-containing protein
MRSRFASVLAALLAAAALVPISALADGDPASDVLLGENVFYPYSPPVSSSLQKTLDAETAAATRAGFPVKVALIASPVDLGVIPDLFGKPQQYARFLDQEISFQTKQQLLVVMSTGYGVQGLGRPATTAAGSLARPAGKQSNDLARAAITAVAKLSAAAGHPITGVPGIPGASSGGGGGATTVIIVALALAALATAGALVAKRRRRAAA